MIGSDVFVNLLIKNTEPKRPGHGDAAQLTQIPWQEKIELPKQLMEVKRATELSITARHNKD